MNVLNIELYSLCILVILAFDYLARFRKHLNVNSWLYVIIVLSIALLSVINIFLFKTTDTSAFMKFAFSFGYVLLGIPSTALGIYINVNLFEHYHLIKKYILHGILFMQLYTITILLYFINVVDKIDFQYSHIGGLYKYNNVLLLSLLPLLIIFIKNIYMNVAKKAKFNYRITLAFLLPLIGLIVDINNSELILIVPAYVLSTLSIYLYRTDIVLNIDPLTGIYNRRVLNDKEYDKRRNTKALIAAYLIDIDDFKFYNDTYGHNEGDIVLKAVSDIIKKSIRKTDVPIRLGGDEFLIIATIDSETNLKVIVNNLKNNLKEYNRTRDKEDINVSIGYNIYKNDQLFDDFINDIDNRMYLEKEEKKQTKKKK